MVFFAYYFALVRLQEKVYRLWLFCFILYSDRELLTAHLLW